MRSFGTEAMLAALLTTAGLLVYSGFATLQGDLENPRTLWLAQAQIVVGAALGVLALGAGLGVAFGFGPRLLARRVEGVVASRSVFADGEIYEDGDPELLGGRCYVTLWHPEDRLLTELWCSREIYRRLHKGDTVTVRAVGRRLLTVERPPLDIP